MPLSPQPLEEIDRTDHPTDLDDDVEPRAAAGAVVPPVRLAGWYPDPRGRYDVRYWDGLRWTFRVGTVNLPPEGASVPEATLALDHAVERATPLAGPSTRRWRTHLLVAGLGLLAVTGWGFGIMKATADTPAVPTPASVTAERAPAP